MLTRESTTSMHITQVKIEKAWIRPVLNHPITPLPKLSGGGVTLGLDYRT